MSQTSVIRIYEGEHLAEEYEKYRPMHPTWIRDLIIENLQERQLRKSLDKDKFGRMLDVGCGGGQFTFMFETYFDSILGIDISPGQVAIAEARNKSDNIQFRIVHDNFLPVDDGSVDLITCAVSAHWLDLKIFVKECLRILKPNGYVAIYTYVPCGLRYECLVDGREEVMENYEGHVDLLWKFLNDCKAHPRNAMWMNGYKDLFERIPIESKRWIQTASYYKDYTLKELVLFWETLGEYHDLPAEFKEEDGPLEAFKLGVKKLVNKEEEKDEDIHFQQIFRMPLILFSL